MKTIATLGNYDIIKQLGVGGSCVCTLAKDQVTGEQFAIKIFNYDYDIDMIKEEVKVMGCFNHPNIIKMVENSDQVLTFKSGKKKHVKFMAMEYA